MRLFGPRKLGLALGSGSARGIAHIGVLKALERAGIRPDVVTGTSMGAVIGAMYAAGKDIAEIERIALGFDVRSLLSLADVTILRGAILSGERVEEFLRELLPERFEDLGLPFGCASTDLSAGCAVAHTSGPLVDAVRASLSVPVVLLPVDDGERLLVDGFLTDPIPVALARTLGAEVVVAVDVSGAGSIERVNGDGLSAGPLKELRAALRGEGPRRRGTSSLDIAAATVEIMERRVAAPALADADVVISPEVHGFGGYEFLAAEKIAALGEEAGRAAADEIRRKAHLPRAH